ncbi:sorbosone dehydrogenase family protein, partial [bacterium]|nr:sorbosone dehydrogenase family protein [bacterium]
MSQKIFTRPLIAAALILTGCFNSLGIEQAKVPLSKLRLPPGFQISIFSDEVPGVRSLALSEDGVVFAGTRGEKVYSIEDKDRDGTADSVKTLVDGMNMPNGIAFHGGALYVAEVNQVWRFEKGKKVDFSDSRRKLIRGDLPKDVHHGWKYIRFGPDGMLYIPVGAPCNVCLKKDPRYASLLKMKPDGTDLAVYASGIRNTVGFDWDPRTGNLWFTD